MPCTLCASSNRVDFPGQISLQFPLFKNLTNPSVLVFPQISVCLDCGVSLFTVPPYELQMLRDGHQGNQTTGIG